MYGSIGAVRIQLLLFENFTHEYVERLTRGDGETERHFVNYFSDLLLIKLCRILRSRQAVDDLRQETFLRVFSILRNKGGIDRPERLGAFVYGVCNNVLLEHYRSEKVLCNQQVLDCAGPEASPEAEFVSAERKLRVRQILATLPPKDRNILRLIFLEEQDKDDVCKLYGVDREYLRVLVHRAKNRFRESLLRRQKEVTPRRGILGMPSPRVL